MLPIYLQNKQQIGKVEEVLGPIQEVYFTIKCSEGIKAGSFKGFYCWALFYCISIFLFFLCVVLRLCFFVHFDRLNLCLARSSRQIFHIAQNYYRWQGSFRSLECQAGHQEEDSEEAEAEVCHALFALMLPFGFFQVGFIQFLFFESRFALLCFFLLFLSLFFVLSCLNLMCLSSVSWRFPSFLTLLPRLSLLPLFSRSIFPVFAFVYHPLNQRVFFRLLFSLLRFLCLQLPSSLITLLFFYSHPPSSFIALLLCSGWPWRICARRTRWRLPRKRSWPRRRIQRYGEREEDNWSRRGTERTRKRREEGEEGVEFRGMEKRRRRRNRRWSRWRNERRTNQEKQDFPHLFKLMLWWLSQEERDAEWIQRSESNTGRERGRER